MRAGQPLQGPGAQGFVLLGLWQPARAVALGSAPWLGVGVGALGGLSRVSAHLGHPRAVCAGAPGHARVEGLHTVWFSAQAPLWVRGKVTVVIILPCKDVGIRAWQGGADHPRLTQTLEPPKDWAPSLSWRGPARPLPPPPTGGGPSPPWSQEA